MSEKKQHSNIIMAAVGFAVVVVAVGIIGLLTLGGEEETLQGEVEVSEYRVSSKLPGRIVETDAKLHDSSSATWYIYPIRMLDAPLAIEAVSVKTNLWACIVTAIAIVGVGGLIALLCGVPARMSASRRAHPMT